MVPTSVAQPVARSRRKRRDRKPGNGKENCEETPNQSLSKLEFQRLDDNELNDLMVGPAESHHEALRLFRKAIKESTLEAEFWMDHAALADTVVHSSLSENPYKGIIYLQEHVAPLLNYCRKVIKAATVEQETSIKANHLFVVVHIIRAITPLLISETSRLETGLRLLFHLITTASDLFSVLQGFKAELICLGAYEALTKLLMKYSCPLRTLGDSVAFELACDNIFCLPVKSSDPRGNMTLRQISTIALKSTFVVTSALSNLWWSKEELATREKLTTTSSFGLLVRRLIAETSKEHAPLHLTITLLQFIATPWISYLLDNADEDEFADVVLHCKTAHKILWETASKLETASNCRSKQNHMEYSLELRKASILALIPRNCPSKYVALLRKHLLETAYSASWKAAAAYVQQAGGLDSIAIQSRGVLTKFHQEIWDRLNYLSSSRTPFSLGYAEYRAIRSLHLAKISTSHCCMSEACCVVDLLPVESQNQGDEDAMSRTILAIFQLSLFIRHRLEAPECQTSIFSTWPCAANIDLIDYSMRLLQFFKTYFLADKHQSLPGNIRQRGFKLLCYIPLHRALFQIQSRPTLTLLLNEVEVAALILLQCFAPFCCSLLKTDNCENSKIAQFFDLATECNLRSACALDRLGGELHGNDPDSATRLLVLSNEAIGNIFRLLSETGMPIPQGNCLEKSAKVRKSTSVNESEG